LGFIKQTWEYFSLQFVIRVDSVNTDFDNFVILDDFEVLGAGGCGQLGVEAAQRGWLANGGLYTTPMLSALLNRPIHSAKVFDPALSQDCLR
jgi:hypothetical protein